LVDGDDLVAELEALLVELCFEAFVTVVVLVVVVVLVIVFSLVLVSADFLEEPVFEGLVIVAEMIKKIHKIIADMKRNFILILKI
jgi:hypothetical protein